MKKVLLLIGLVGFGWLGQSWAGPMGSPWLAFPGGPQGAVVEGGEPHFTSCTELGGYIREMIASGSRLGGPEFMAGDVALSPPGQESEAAGPQYSETNLQEKGVDEADIIKTDGQYMYLANAGYFSVVRAYPPAATELLFSHKLEGEARGLYLLDQLAVVLSEVWGQAELTGQAELSGMMQPLTQTLTKLEIFDITDPAVPQRLREVYLEGQLNTSRRVAQQLHLVIDSFIHRGYQVPMATPEPSATPFSQLARRAMPSAYQLEGLVPRLLDQTAGEAPQTRLLTPCDQYLVPPRQEGANVISILTLNLDDPLGELSSTSLLSDSGQVYASQEHLYVATMANDYWTWASNSSETTRIYRFALGDKALLQGVGEVPGSIINRYAMGEWEGYLRIATTRNNWGSVENQPENSLYVLGLAGDQLEVVGSLMGLGHPGERIYAVRFDGARGYLVTFRDTDPLYTLDLADPTQPLALGELEIPGFSTYLQPMGEHHLLGIGRDPDRWTTDLSLYDIRDFSRPQLVDRLSLGENSWSEALYEPKAFTWFAPAGLLVVPINSWGSLMEDRDEPVKIQANGAVVLEVDTATGFGYRGMVSHEPPRDNPWASADVRRSLFVGQADSWVLYTLSDGLLKASDAADPKQQLAAQPLPRVEPLYWVMSAVSAGQ